MPLTNQSDGVVYDLMNNEKPGTVIRSTMSFLYEMAQNKQRANQNKRQGDQGYNPETHGNRMIHVVIHGKNQRRKSQTEYGEDDSADQLPFPGNNQKDDQDVGWNEVDKEPADLLPEGQP